MTSYMILEVAVAVDVKNDFEIFNIYGVRAS